MVGFISNIFFLCVFWAGIAVISMERPEARNALGKQFLREVTLFEFLIPAHNACIQNVIHM